jgi:hypothetical protein
LAWPTEDSTLPLVPKARETLKLFQQAESLREGLLREIQQSFLHIIL